MPHQKECFKIAQFKSQQNFHRREKMLFALPPMQPPIMGLLARPRKECCTKVLPVPILVDVTLSEVKRAKPVPRFKDPI